MILNGRFRSLPPGHYSGLTHTTDPIRVVMTCSECGLDRDSFEFESLSSPCRSCVASHSRLESVVAGGSCPDPVASDARGCPPYRVGQPRTIRTPESGKKPDPNVAQPALNRPPTAPNRRKEPENYRISKNTAVARSVHGGCTGIECGSDPSDVGLTSVWDRSEAPERDNSPISEVRAGIRSVYGGNTDSVGRHEPTKAVIRPSPGPQEALKDSPITDRDPERDKQLLDPDSPGSTAPVARNRRTREEEDGVD